jgi:hypothetical protein
MSKKGVVKLDERQKLSIGIARFFTGSDFDMPIGIPKKAVFLPVPIHRGAK